jgi:hypothetical protein
MQIIVPKKDEGWAIDVVPAHKIGDIDLVNDVMRKLLDHYPGYRWRVGINDETTGGVMYIMNMDVNAALWSNAPYGYVLKLTTVYDDPSLKCAVRAAGEILERARIARGKKRDEKINLVDGAKDNHQPVKIISEGRK